jgi:essential nuclear protein 1
MPKATTPKSAAGRRALTEEYLASGILKNRPSKRSSKSRDNEEPEFVDSRASRKILDIGRQLAEEDAASARPAEQPTTAFGFDSRYQGLGEEDLYDEDDVWAENEDNDDDEIMELEELEPADLDIFQKFLPTNDDPLLSQGPWPTNPSVSEQEGTSTNLADLVSRTAVKAEYDTHRMLTTFPQILARIAAHEAGGPDRPQEIEPVDQDYELSPKVVEVYSKIGIFLSRYKSGKLPKPFKILPTVPGWEDILLITQPEKYAVLNVLFLFVLAKRVASCAEKIGIPVFHLSEYVADL